MMTTRLPLSDLALRRWAMSVWWAFVGVIALSIAVDLAAQGGEGIGPVMSESVFVLIVSSFPLSGMLVLRRQPRNPIGWVLLGIGIAWGLGGISDAYATYGLVVDPGSLPAPKVAAALNQGVWAPAIGLMTTLLILLYPDGRPPSPRWRWVAWLCGVTIAVVYVGITLSPGEMSEGPGAGEHNPLGLDGAGDELMVATPFALTLLPLCVVLCAIGLVVRFRRSTGVEREQLKWLATAGAVVALMFAASMAITILREALDIDGPEPGWMLLLQNLSVSSFLLIPLAIGVAILRHRLYDIDVVLNRALVYLSLTATLAGFYLVAVLLLGRVLAPVTGESDLAVAASTLGVAALFRPLRSRIQSTVDRRFYRRQYDAARTLRAFAGRLRQQVELPTITADLRAVVRDTVQPEHVSLWLRDGAERVVTIPGRRLDRKDAP